MTFNIEYSKQFTKEHTNFILVLTKLSELKSIKNLPFDIKKMAKSVNIDKIFNNEVNSEYLIQSSKFNLLLNLRLVLIKNPKKVDAIKVGAELCAQVEKKQYKELNFIFSNNLIKNFNFLCSNLFFGFFLKSYNFTKYKKGKNKFNEIKINIHSNKNKLKKISYFENLLTSINYCKDLVSEPANVLNPLTFSERCMKLKKLGLKIKILDKTKIEKIGMRSLLGVAQGSINEPRVVILEWNCNKISRPTILVGKGVTFDTGGISLKPSAGMEEMIIDMTGSAVVVGSMVNAALNKINKSIVGIIGLVENMPDGKAQRPGDIVRSLSGDTIEVLNTDAEGRMVLADILTYAQIKYKPKEIIDFATLTGAILVALGTYKAGLFSNNDKLSNKIFEAGEITNEKVWRLPLSEEYDSDIDSNRADIQNIGSSRYGGSIQAAQFLQRFIKNSIPWAHLDIAGVSWTKGSSKGFSSLHKTGATAFGIRLIDQYLKR